MPSFPRDEVVRAFEAYWRLGAIEERWDEWAQVFTEDVYYVEHVYGDMHGRDAVHAWITGLMADNADVHAVLDWFMVEGQRVVLNMQNRYYHPVQGEAHLDFPGITVLHYAGGGKFSYEEDYWCVTRAKRCHARFQELVREHGRGLGHGRLERLEAERLEAFEWVIRG